MQYRVSKDNMSGSNITSQKVWFAELEDLINSKFRDEVNKRVKEFESFRKKDGQEIFFELCYCFLTANTSAELGIKMQRELGLQPFIEDSTEVLTAKLKSAHYRFYNTRGKFISENRWIIPELPVLLNHPDPWVAREFIVENVKGIGYKESSHFLRNTGVFDFAILDKHIIRMLDGDFAKSGKTLNRKLYMKYEQQLIQISEDLGLKPGVLDLYMWKMATGKLIK